MNRKLSAALGIGLGSKPRLCASNTILFVVGGTTFPSR